MELFLSHASSDADIAEAIKLRFNDLPSVNVRSSSDIEPGRDWELTLRTAVRDCDAVLCLVTPDYIRRPWFYAEWAAFWFQNKPWYVLLLDATLDQVFEVMKRRQVTRMDDRRAVERLFQVLADGNDSDRALDLLARETVEAVLQAKARQVRAKAEANLARLAVSLRMGGADVDSLLVGELVDAGQVDRVVEVARAGASFSDVKRRQLGAYLVERGHASAASKFDELIASHAERKNLGLACLDRLKAFFRDEPARELVFKIYRAVRDPQRRVLRKRAEDLELVIDWPELEANP